MIWTATHDDLEQLRAYGRGFYDESGYGDYLSFDADKTATLFKDMIESDGAIILMTEGGFTGAAMSQLYFTQDWLAQELFWYVSPEHRGQGAGWKMRQALEDWASEMGARLFVMSALEMRGESKAVQAYKDAGYFPVEHSFARSF